MRVWFALLCVGCSFRHGLPLGDDDSPDTDAPPPIDALDIDAPPPFASGPFGMATRVPISAAGVREDDITLTGDMLEIYWEADPNGTGSDIYIARRAKVTDPWSLPSKVTELSTGSFEGSINISTDGLTIYFASDRSPSTSLDYYVARRPDRGTPWSTPELLTTVSDATRADYDAAPWGNNTLFLGSNRVPARGGSDVWRSKRTNAVWSMPELVPGLDTMMYEGEAFADATGAIWFTGDGAGDDDIYYAKPNGDGGTFQAATLIMEICGPAAENDPWVSPDGHVIYFTSDRGNTAGSLDIYMATR